MVLDLVEVVLIIVAYTSISVAERGDKTEIDIHFVQWEQLWR
jgi:hypothetical protein